MRRPTAKTNPDSATCAVVLPGEVVVKSRGPKPRVQKRTLANTKTAGTALRRKSAGASTRYVLSASSKTSVERSIRNAETLPEVPFE